MYNFQESSGDSSDDEEEESEEEHVKASKSQGKVKELKSSDSSKIITTETQDNTPLPKKKGLGKSSPGKGKKENLDNRVKHSTGKSSTTLKLGPDSDVKNDNSNVVYPDEYDFDSSDEEVSSYSHRYQGSRYSIGTMNVRSSVIRIFIRR